MVGWGLPGVDNQLHRADAGQSTSLIVIGGVAADSDRANDDLAGSKVNRGSFISLSLAPSTLV